MFSHLLSQDVDVVSHLPRRNFHLHPFTFTLLVVGLLYHLHLAQWTCTHLDFSCFSIRSLTAALWTCGSGSDQLSWPQVQQNPLCVLTVVTTLHKSQQQLGGIVLSNSGINSSQTNGLSRLSSTRDNQFYLFTDRNDICGNADLKAWKQTHILTGESLDKYWCLDTFDHLLHCASDYKFKHNYILSSVRFPGASFNAQKHENKKNVCKLLPLWCHYTGLCLNEKAESVLPSAAAPSPSDSDIED